MQNFGRKNLDDSTSIRQLCQTFPPSKSVFVLYGMYICIHAHTYNYIAIQTVYSYTYVSQPTQSSYIKMQLWPRTKKAVV